MEVQLLECLAWLVLLELVLEGSPRSRESFEVFHFSCMFP